MSAKRPGLCRPQPVTAEKGHSVSMGEVVVSRLVVLSSQTQAPLERMPSLEAWFGAQYQGFI